MDASTVYAEIESARSVWELSVALEKVRLLPESGRESLAELIDQRMVEFSVIDVSPYSPTEVARLIGEESMDIKPEQIPDEVVEAACAALAVAMEFGDTWPGDYAEEQQNELRQAMRLSLAATLPVLLGEKSAWWEYHHRNDPNWYLATRAAVRNRAFNEANGYEYRPLYRLPTQDIANVEVA